MPAEVMTHARSLLLTLLLGSAACSGSQTIRTTYRYAGNDSATMTDVDIRPGAMPDNDTFSGSYHSQQIGDLFLEQTGDHVVGTYAYDRGNCRATGRFEGSAQGNLLRFTWTESQASCGRLAPLRGRGYFLFWKDSAGNGRVNGQWGTGENESGGGPWSGFRDRVRREPGEAPPPVAGRTGEGVFTDAPRTPPPGAPTAPAPR